MFKKLFCKHEWHRVTHRVKLQMHPNFTTTMTHKKVITKTCKYCGKVKTKEVF